MSCFEFEIRNMEPEIQTIRYPLHTIRSTLPALVYPRLVLTCFPVGGLTQSTPVEKSLQIHPFLCKTNPIFPIFCLKTMISSKNKPNSNPIKANFSPKIRVANPIQTQIKPNFVPISLGCPVRFNIGRINCVNNCFLTSRFNSERLSQ
jgi:hypothetical protein